MTSRHASMIYMAVSTSHIQLYIHTRKCHVAKIRYVCRELNPNSQPLRNKKIEKNTRQRKKQLHAQDSIYVVRQFAYVHGIARISLLSEKNTKVRLQFFLSHKNTATTPQTLITNNRFLYNPRRLVHERSSLGLSAQASTPWTKLQ